MDPCARRYARGGVAAALVAGSLLTVASPAHAQPGSTRGAAKTTKATVWGAPAGHKHRMGLRNDAKRERPAKRHRLWQPTGPEFMDQMLEQLNSNAGLTEDERHWLRPAVRDGLPYSSRWRWNADEQELTKRDVLREILTAGPNAAGVLVALGPDTTGRSLSRRVYDVAGRGSVVAFTERGTRRSFEVEPGAEAGQHAWTALSPQVRFALHPRTARAPYFHELYPALRPWDGYPRWLPSADRGDSPESVAVAADRQLRGLPLNHHVFGLRRGDLERAFAERFRPETVWRLARALKGRPDGAHGLLRVEVSHPEGKAAVHAYYNVVTRDGSVRFLDPTRGAFGNPYADPYELQDLPQAYLPTGARAVLPARRLPARRLPARPPLDRMLPVRTIREVYDHLLTAPERSKAEIFTPEGPGWWNQHMSWPSVRAEVDSSGTFVISDPDPLKGSTFFTRERVRAHKLPPAMLRDHGVVLVRYTQWAGATSKRTTISPTPVGNR